MAGGILLKGAVVCAWAGGIGISRLAMIEAREADRVAQALLSIPFDFNIVASRERLGVICN